MGQGHTVGGICAGGTHGLYIVRGVWVDCRRQKLYVKEVAAALPVARAGEDNNFGYFCTLWKEIRTNVAC